MISPRIKFSFFGVRRMEGFSLVEMLMVVAVLSLLLTAASMSFSDPTSSKVRGSLVSLSTNLELARQSALSENTYAYVALTTPAVPGGACYLAAFVSPTGVDVLAPGGAAPAEDAVRLISRVVKLDGIRIEADNPLGSLLNDLPAGAKSPQAGNLAAITLSETPHGPLTFDRIVKFSPQGLALIYDTPVEWIQLVVVPQHGAEVLAAETKQVSAITVAGLTGRIFFHRP